MNPPPLPLSRSSRTGLFECRRPFHLPCEPSRSTLYPHPATPKQQQEGDQHPNPNPQSSGRRARWPPGTLTDMVHHLSPSLNDSSNHPSCSPSPSPDLATATAVQTQQPPGWMRWARHRQRCEVGGRRLTCGGLRGPAAVRLHAAAPGGGERAGELRGHAAQSQRAHEHPRQGATVAWSPLSQSPWRCSRAWAAQSDTPTQALHVACSLYSIAYTYPLPIITHVPNTVAGD